MNKILLLDSNSLINRAFYALPISMQTRDGQITNAIHGYLSMLYSLIQSEKPTHIAAVFDMRAPTFRHKLYTEYKGTRPPMSEELASQIPVLKEILEDMNIKILGKEGSEADDIIGTLAKRFIDPTIIVTGDRDCLQLIDDSTTVYITKKGVADIKKYDIPALAEEGFKPYQIIEYKGLAGDSSDNIPGAKGVGDKTAKSLLSSYENIEGVYNAIEEISGKLKERLAESKEMVLLSKTLATIDTNVDIACSMKDIEFNYPLPAKALPTMQRFELKSLITRYEFEENTVIAPIRIIPPLTVLNDLSEAERIIAKIPENSEVALYFSEEPEFSFSGKSYKLSLNNDLLFGWTENSDIFKAFSPLFSEKYCKVIYDVKEAMHLLKEYGFCIKPPYADVLLKAHLSNSTRNISTVDALIGDYGFDIANKAGSLSVINSELNAELSEKKLTSLYSDLEQPLIACLFDMEISGFRIDTEVLDSLSVQYKTQIDDLTEDIYKKAGERFNINSNKQLAEILFEKLKLPASKKIKTGYSVAASTLEELEHPVVEDLLKYRQLVKLQSTYIDGMKKCIKGSDNRIFTSFKQCVTATGRLSSVEPNLQNIPVRTAEGREIRKMFIPSKGNTLVTADYSQIELRLLAHFSEDEKLISAYKEAKDIHALTASKVYGIPLEMLTPSMRRSAKAINFGIIYGISSFGLANQLDIPVYRAKEFVENYFKTYPKVKGYMENNVRLAKEQGYLTTLAGRIRYFPELNSPNHNIRSFGERAAMNMPLQGSAADIIKIAMLRVANALKDKGLRAKMILQVHDELIIDTPKDEVETVKNLLAECMEQAVSLRVPLVVNVGEGYNWFEAK